MLGVCFDGKRYKTVCACRDFIEDEDAEMLIPYTALRNDASPLIMERNDDSFAASCVLTLRGSWTRTAQKYGPSSSMRGLIR